MSVSWDPWLTATLAGLTIGVAKDALVVFGVKALPHQSDISSPSLKGSKRNPKVARLTESKVSLLNKAGCFCLKAVFPPTSGVPTSRPRTNPE